MPSGKRGRAAAALATHGDDAEPLRDVQAPKRQKASRTAKGAAPAALAPAAAEVAVAVAPEKRAGKPSVKKRAAEQATRPAAKAKPAAKAVDKAAKRAAAQQTKEQAAAVKKAQAELDKELRRVEAARKKEAKATATAEARAVAKALKKAAAAEQRQLKDAEEAERKKEAAAAKAAAVEEEKQARRRPRSADGETGTADSTRDMLEAVAERFVAEDADDRAARRALLLPLFAEAPASELLEFCAYVRESFHKAYGDASELPAASWANANLTLRVEAVGPDARKELTRRWLELPSVVAAPASRARLSLFWDEVLQEFKKVNTVRATAMPEAAAPAEGETSGKDRQVASVAPYLYYDFPYFSHSPCVPIFTALAMLAILLSPARITRFTRLTRRTRLTCRVCHTLARLTGHGGSGRMGCLLAASGSRKAARCGGSETAAAPSRRAHRARGCQHNVSSRPGGALPSCSTTIWRLDRHHVGGADCVHISPDHHVDPPQQGADRRLRRLRVPNGRRCGSRGSQRQVGVLHADARRSVGRAQGGPLPEAAGQVFPSGEKWQSHVCVPPPVRTVH